MGRGGLAGGTQSLGVLAAPCAAVGLFLIELCSGHPSFSIGVSIFKSRWQFWLPGSTPRHLEGG